MSQTVDILQTTFVTTGIQPLVNALTAAENATDRLTNAQARLVRAKLTGNQPGIDMAQRRLNMASRNVLRETFSEATVAAQPFLNVLKEIDKAASHAIETFRSFGHEVLDIQALTGANRKEASGGLALLNAAGIHDKGALKTLLNMGNAAFGGESAGALSQLGITPMAGQSSIQVLNQVIDKLSTLHDGLYKAHLETQLFGEGGAESLQPLLRMSRETREQIARFSEGMGDGAETTQKLDEASAKLSAGWEALTVRVGRPLAEVLAGIEEAMVTLLDQFDRFDKWSHGAGTALILFAGLASSILAGAAAMQMLIKAFAALNAVLKFTITFQAVLDALQGNAVAIGAAAAVAIGGYVVMNNTGGGNSSGTTDQFGRHVANFGRAVDSFNNANGNARQYLSGPLGALSDPEIARLTSEMAQGAIG